MSPKNAILVLIIMACVSFAGLFYLYKTKTISHKIQEIRSEVKQEDMNIKKEYKKTISPEDKLKNAQEALLNMQKNSTTTEEYFKNAQEALLNIQKNSTTTKEDLKKAEEALNNSQNNN